MENSSDNLRNNFERHEFVFDLEIPSTKRLRRINRIVPVFPYGIDRILGDMAMIDSTPLRWSQASIDFMNYYNFQNGGRLEIMQQLVWSTRRSQFEKPASREIFFTTSRGDDPSETNLWQPSQFPNPCAMLVQEIQIKCDNEKLIQNAVFSLVVGSKYQGEIPLHAFRYEKGFFISDAIEAFIGPLMNFCAYLTWKESKRRNMVVQIYLKGRYARAVS